MNTVLLAVAVVRSENQILIRKMDSAKSPYTELWALFGGKVEDGSSIADSLNKELMARWNFSVSLTEKLWWDEEVKVDHDGEEKWFVYLDILCKIESGTPNSVNPNEVLEWAAIEGLHKYDFNPPTKTLLQRLNLLS